MRLTQVLWVVIRRFLLLKKYQRDCLSPKAKIHKRNYLFNMPFHVGRNTLYTLYF